MELSSETNPFQDWEDAISLNEKGSIKESGSTFARSSQHFFEFGSNVRRGVARAFFEYSTLMDSFSKIQEARLTRLESRYDESLKLFGDASEILRATVHFGFLSAYETACATLETAGELEDEAETFEALKNAISLFEQSKLALGLRDELHPAIHIIDAMIKYSISKALLAESEILAGEGKRKESEEKNEQSRRVSADYIKLAGSKHGVIDYFPISDWLRAKSGGFVASYQEKDAMWFGNIGPNPVIIERAGACKVGLVVQPFQSISVDANSLGKGRIRVVYRDLKISKSYDEGCVLMV